jgi:FkbM family methyltransferase
MVKLKDYLPDIIYKPGREFYDKYLNPFYFKSYSQEGEDRILERIFNQKKEGFYVDVGAHHPKRFSNTYSFYKRGWRGINIEARPGSKKIFDKYRPRDVNLETAVSSENKTLTYYMFNEPALNGFSENVAKSKNGFGDYRIINQIELKTQPLSEILNNHLAKNENIDLINIDVEGLDYDVLLSNDWNKFKPSIILVEEGEFDMQNVNQSVAYNFLLEKEYELIAKTFNTLFFKCSTYL